MISFHHTYKTYPGPVNALKDVTIEVAKGEFVFLTGPSGAGKTTLFRLLSAFDRPTSGRVVVGGMDISSLSAGQVPFFRRRLGVVYQDFRLLRNRTVFENVALPLEIIGMKPDAIERRVREILAQVSLAAKAEQHPEQLSGGEQQRVAVARALVHRPGVLIADEPTGNLDRQLSFEIMDLFEKVNAQGTTVFIATHDQEIVKSRRRRVIEIREGVVTGDRI